MSTAKKSRRLGRGLSSLVGDPLAVPVATNDISTTTEAPAQPDAPNRSARDEPSETSDAVRMIRLNLIIPNTYQPRNTFDDDALAELADSIRLHGVMQPIVVRPAADGRFELVAGERRWRAAGTAGLDEIPAIVKSCDHQTSAEWALIENIQRTDLNPLDKARGMDRLRVDFGLSHAEIAERLGSKRSSVSNLLRILELEPEILAAIETETLSLGHAKVLVGTASGPDRVELATKAINEGWSVRTLEEQATANTDAPSGTTAGNQSASGNTTRVGSAQAANIRRLEATLSETLATRVKIRTAANGRKGSINIEFYDLDHFDGMLKRLGVDSLE